METSTNTPTPHTASIPEPHRFPVEKLEAESKEPNYILAAARASRGWLSGQELSRDEFTQAIAHVKGVEIK